MSTFARNRGIVRTQNFGLWVGLATGMVGRPISLTSRSKGQPTISTFCAVSALPFLHKKGAYSRLPLISALHANQGPNPVPHLEDGFEMISEFLSHDQVNLINSEIEAVGFPAKTGGIRNAEKKYLSIRELANSEQLSAKAEEYLSGAACLVRAILFNKTSESNCLVTWHQDRTVAVSERFEKHGWGPWSVKDATHHVQPPLSVLNQMVTFRVHLDETNVENGCIKILPNSHRLGILDHRDIQEYVKNHEPVICEAPAGSALIMCPHILHSSGKAASSSQRRVLHLEYCSFKLPCGATWA